MGTTFEQWWQEQATDDILERTSTIDLCKLAWDAGCVSGMEQLAHIGADARADMLTKVERMIDRIQSELTK